jgi:hypothetical protein
MQVVLIDMPATFVKLSTLRPVSIILAVQLQSTPELGGVYSTCKYGERTALRRDLVDAARPLRGNAEAIDWW